jgi:hypothetical protein
MQSREMGQKKSSEWRWLARHLLIQFSFFLFGLGIFSLFAEISVQAMLLIPILNTLVHGVIDWNIWNGYKLLTHKRLISEANRAAYMNGNLNIPFEERAKVKYDEKLASFKYWEDHLFYSTIGFDQLLHGLTIIALFAILI